MGTNPPLVGKYSEKQDYQNFGEHSCSVPVPAHRSYSQPVKAASNTRKARAVHMILRITMDVSYAPSSLVKFLVRLPAAASLAASLPGIR